MYAARYWLFQFNPKVYLWFERMLDTGGNKPEQWLAHRYSEYMKKGDFVAIRASGKDAGIYALGQLITSAVDKVLDKSDLKYWIKEEAANKFLYNRSVLVEYYKNLSTKPILDVEYEKDEVLKDLKTLTRQQATNFQIKSEQWQRIVELASIKV
ncbi:MAG TPA: EVE domain-containing protein [Candidatus Acidoferrales bacterium]|nr:EVE domain-containing protein [Candidatus Acidoferrales bacterium]